MQCRDFREIADSYISDELLVETNHEVLSHLEACADCRREFAARRQLRARMREAFARSPEFRIDDEFGARLRAQLGAAARHQARKPAFTRIAWLALAAGLVMAAMLGLLIFQRQRRGIRLAQTDAQRDNSQEARTSPTMSPSDVRTSVHAALADMTTIAAGDHRDCAVNHRLAEMPIPLEEAGHRYDPAYIDLTKSVKAWIENGSEIEFVTAHSCVFEGRRFAHIVLRRRGQLVSLLVTDVTRSGANGQATAERSRQPQVISCSEAEGYQVSCFETIRHAVFIVSELNEAENLSVARMVAPAVAKHLTRAEATA